VEKRCIFLDQSHFTKSALKTWNRTLVASFWTNHISPSRALPHMQFSSPPRSFIIKKINFKKKVVFDVNFSKEKGKTNGG
jgi:hypothetical protein